jgi:hypothetical protein
MKEKIIELLNYFRIRTKGIFHFIRNPKYFLAHFFYSLYKGDRDKIPFPIFDFIVGQMGGWAGVGIILNMRRYEYNLKLSKARTIIIYVVGSLLILLILGLGITQGSESIFFGFAQNLLSDIILIILVIYLLPKLLNKPKKYNISLVQERPYIYGIKEADEDKELIIISIFNSGEEVYKEKEISWEILIPFDTLDEKDINIICGTYEGSEELIGHMWKLSGINSSPLFIDQRLCVARIKFKHETLSGPEIPPLKIYYIFRTINGNIPAEKDVTRDFMGWGMSSQQYPRIGELVLQAWNNPNIFKAVG